MEMHIVARKHAPLVRPDAGSLEPAILTLLSHSVLVPLHQLQLILLLRLVVVQGDVTGGGYRGKISDSRK